MDLVEAREPHATEQTVRCREETLHETDVGTSTSQVGILLERNGGLQASAE